MNSGGNEVSDSQSHHINLNINTILITIMIFMYLLNVEWITRGNSPNEPILIFIRQKECDSMFHTANICDQSHTVTSEVSLMRCGLYSVASQHPNKWVSKCNGKSKWEQELLSLLMLHFWEEWHYPHLCAEGVVRL